MKHLYKTTLRALAIVTLLLTLLPSALRAQGTNSVNGLENLSNNKVYTIRTVNRGNLRHEGSNTKVTAPTNGTYNANDTHQQWAILTINGYRYLYNVGAGKFASKNGEVLDLVEAPGEAARVTIEYVNNTAGYPWTMKFDGKWLNCNNTTNGYEVNAYNTLDDGNQFAFVEVGNFTGLDDVLAGSFANELLTEARNVLATRGVGYPKTTSAEYTALNNAINAYNTAVASISSEQITYTLTHTTNVKALTAGTKIALQCRDTGDNNNGGYLNGAAAKSAFSNENNVYILEAAATGFYLKRVSDNQYIAHGNGFSNQPSITQSTNPSDATAFTFALATVNNWTSMMTGTTNGEAMRLTAVDQNTYLNTNSGSATPKYHNGTGGFSVWYVYICEAQNLSVAASIYGAIHTALTNYYNCSDVEQPVDGHYYSVTPTDGSAATTYLAVANANNTFRLVGPEAKYSNGTGYTDAYSAAANNLSLTKYGRGVTNFGFVNFGGTTPTARWEEVAAPSAITPVYEGADERKIKMTLPGINTEHVAVYVGDVKQNVPVTAGENTVVILPSVAAGTVFTVFVGDGSIVRKITYTRPNTYYVTVHHRLYGSGVSDDDLATVIEEVEASAAHTWQPRRVTLPAGYDIYGGEWPQWDIIENEITSLEIFYTYDAARMPIQPSVKGEDGHLTTANYYTMTVHGKSAYFQLYTSGGSTTNQIKLGTRNTLNACDYFYFVGDNETGFTVHSTAVSPALSFDINNRKFTKEANKYILLDTYDGTTHKYAFRVATSQALMNEDYGNTGNLGIWSGSPSPTHENALFTFSKADNATVEAAIADMALPQEGKYYYVKSCYTGFSSTKAFYLDGNTPKWKEFSNTDWSLIWSWTPADGGYAVQNQSNLRYLKNNTTTSDTEAAATYLLSHKIASGDNRFGILTNAEQALHCNGHGNGQNDSGDCNTNWYADVNSPSSWSIVELTDDDFDAIVSPFLTQASDLDFGTNIGQLDVANQATVQAAVAAVQGEGKKNFDNIRALHDAIALARANYAPVTVECTLDGTTVIDKVVYLVATEADIPTRLRASMYAQDEQGYYTLSDVTKDNGVYKVNVTTGTLPFIVSTQDAPHWYAMLIRPDNNRHYLYYDPTDPNDDLKTNGGEYNDATDSYAWAITGNVVEGFEIYNNAAGWDLSVTSPDPATTASGQTGADILPQVSFEDGTSWKLYKNSHATNGFFLGYGVNGAKMNYRSTLAFWTGGADIGSTFLAKEPWDAFVAHNNIATSAALAAVAGATAEQIGDGVGYYSQAMVDAAGTLDLSEALAEPAAETYDGQVAQIEAIRAMVAPNLPKHNTFYRIKGGFSQKYLYAQADNDNENGGASDEAHRYKMGDKDAAHKFEVIWYLDDNNSWIGYANGKGIIGTLGQSPVTAKCEQFAFKTESFARPYLSMVSNYSGSKYAYDGETTLNRNGSIPTGDDAMRCAWLFEEVTALPVTIGSAGYASFYTPVTVTVPTGVTAYVAEKKDGYLHLVEVSTISAGQGVILKGSADTYDFPIAGSDNDKASALTGKVASAVSQAGDYVLSKGTINGQEHQVGFFPVRDGEILKGFKAYLPNATVEVRAFAFSFDEIETAIDAATDTTMQQGVMYNLRGQRVMKANGFVIVNGKKVIVK